MRTRKSTFLRLLEKDSDALRLSLGDAWPYFRHLRRALNLAVAAHDTAKARQLEAQIKTLIAVRIPAETLLRFGIVLTKNEPPSAGRRNDKASGFRTTRSAGSYLKVITAPGSKRGSRTVAVGSDRFRLHDAASVDDDLGGAQWTFIAPTVEHTPRTPRGTSSSPRHDNDFSMGSLEQARPAFTPGTFPPRSKGREVFSSGQAVESRPPAPAKQPSSRNISPSPASTPATPPPARADFQFRLEGTGASASGHAALAGGEVDVVFFLAPPSAGALASLSGARLDDAVRRGGRLGAMLVPAGYDLREACPCHQSAQLIAGGMDGEMRFLLTAGPTPDDASGAWVYLDLDGVQLGSFFLAIPIVATDTPAIATSPTPRVIDLDTDGQPTRARLTLTRNGGTLTASYFNQTSEFNSQGPLGVLTPASLEQALDGLRRDVSSVPSSPLWKYLVNPFNQDPTDDQKQSLDEMFATLADAGWALWANLTADPVLATILGDIDRLPAGSRVAVSTDTLFLPWELLYPENPDLFAVKPALFWGARYLFQATLVEDASIARDKREHQNTAIGASLWVNPAIDKDFAGIQPQPAASHHDWAERTRNSLAVPCDEADPKSAKALLLNPKSGPVRKWIYLFCHGRAGATNEMDLGGIPANRVTPATLRGTPPFEGRPIVFLNSCSSGAASPLALTGFYQEFRKSKQVLGLIGTSVPVPATTAAAIGQRVSGLYLDGSHDLASALHTVRRELIDRHIPIGLFYTLHAPGDVRARPDEGPTP